MIIFVPEFVFYLVHLYRILNSVVPYKQCCSYNITIFRHRSSKVKVNCFKRVSVLIEFKFSHSIDP